MLLRLVMNMMNIGNYHLLRLSRSVLPTPRQWHICLHREQVCQMSLGFPPQELVALWPSQVPWRMGMPSKGLRKKREHLEKARVTRHPGAFTCQHLRRRNEERYYVILWTLFIYWRQPKTPPLSQINRFVVFLSKGSRIRAGTIQPQHYENLFYPRR